jgi:hypothetical protein
MNYNWTNVGKTNVDNYTNLSSQREEQKNALIYVVT